MSYSGTVLSGERIGWIDTLRVLACLMVVFSHCCDGFVAQFDSNYTTFLTGVFAGSLFRPSVPLFVMMTGVLLLPGRADESMASFYRRRVGRLITPLVFWSLALPIVAYLYFTGVGAGSTNPSVDMAAYTSDGLVNRLWSWVLNFNFDTTPLWYLYMLIGLYLIMPVVGAWLRQAHEKDIRTFLYVWGLTLLAPYIKLLAPTIGYLGNYGNMDIFGGCDWNAYTMVHYVSGFIGYIVLAYYLKTYPIEWSPRKMMYIFVPMFTIGYAITSVGFVTIQEYHPGDYAYLEVIWLFTGINVFMMTMPVFVVMQRFCGKVRGWMSKLAGLTFGIYLSHFFFVMVGYDLFNVDGLPVVLRILVTGCTVFAVSALLTWLLSLNKLTSKLVK